MRIRREGKLCSARLGFEALEERFALAGAGLTAQYFHNPDFTGLAETRIEAVAHNWGRSGPGAGIDANSFSVRWTGQVEASVTQPHTFRVLSDEGVRVWVDGQLIIDDWSPHTRQVQSGAIKLVAGQRYDIRADYFDLSGEAQIELSWSAPGLPQEVIPASRLYESQSGLLGTYSDATGGRVTRVDANVDFGWSFGSPYFDIDTDHFSATWSGQIRANFSEEYTFSIISDDGARLWIGNELVVDNWTNQHGNEGIGSKLLEAGKWTDLRLEYHEETGPAQIHLRWSSMGQTGAETYEVVPQYALRAMKQTPVTFTNPLGTGADPFVIQWQGSYYMTRSTGGAVWINRADALEEIHASSPGSDTILVWDPPSGTNYSHEIWAPELHRIGNSWYIYVAASNGTNETHRMHVLRRDAADPFGPFTYVSQIVVPTDRWAIDGTVFEWQSSLYYVWSGWPGFQNGRQNLYIARMSNPWTPITERVLLSSPQYAWEMHGLAINEGPQILIENGKLHIIYSASGFWTPQYALGRLSYNGSGSLLSPASWTKSPQPAFQGANGVVGVGHASFVKSPDGTEDWIVYHAHKNPLPPSGEIRDVRIQPFTFNPDGTPNFGSPTSTGTPIRVPSAGPDPQRAFVPGDYNADRVAAVEDYQNWRATFGTVAFMGSAADGNGNGAIDAADYIVWRRHLGAIATQTAAGVDAKLMTASAVGFDPARMPWRGLSVLEYRQSKPKTALLEDVIDAALQNWRAEDAWLEPREKIATESSTPLSYMRKDKDAPAARAAWVEMEIEGEFWNSAFVTIPESA